MVNGWCVAAQENGNLLWRYFSTIYQFSFSMGCLLFSGTDEQQQEWKALSVWKMVYIVGGKKFCIEYVRNANYNIQGVHSGGWIEQTGKDERAAWSGAVVSRRGGTSIMWDTFNCR